MTKKKEESEKVKARVKRYLESHSQILITGLSNENKQSFIDIKGLEDLSHAKKLIKLVEFWNEQHKKEVKEELLKPSVNINGKVKRPLGIKILEPTQNLDSKFIDFLYDFKIYHQAKTGLIKRGKTIREELNKNSDLNKNFKRICERLPEKISKRFKPMYLQGYFYLSESDIKEISQQKKLDSMILLLYKTIEFMNKENPLKEAKKLLR